jgi:hypothetical protein
MLSSLVGPPLSKVAIVDKAFFPSDQVMMFFPSLNFFAQVILASSLAPPILNLRGNFNTPEIEMFSMTGGKI